MSSKELIKKTLLFLSFNLLFFNGLHAGILEPVTVEGRIVGFDRKNVRLAVKPTGEKITVPRKSIPEFFKIKSGRHVYAVLNPKMIMSELKKLKKKGKKRKFWQWGK